MRRAVAARWVAYQLWKIERRLFLYAQRVSPTEGGTFTAAQIRRAIAEQER